MESFACYIEMEPRTLSPGELSNAREKAVEIFLNRNPEEASLIFSKGKKDRNTAAREGEREELPAIAVKNNQRAFQVSMKQWNNSALNFATSKGLDYVKIARQPLSSPF